jgi:glycerol uptake facilitator-like aquaporin
MIPLSRRLAAEALGTALLLAAVVGSGIMAQRLSAETMRSPFSATPWRRVPHLSC